MLEENFKSFYNQVDFMSEDIYTDIEASMKWIASKPLPYSTFSDYMKHSGKYMIYGPHDFIWWEMSLKLISKRLTETDEIIGAKVSVNPAFEVPEGYKLGTDYVLIIYCDDRKREYIRELLSKTLNIPQEKMHWKYDRVTFKETVTSGQPIPAVLQPFVELFYPMR